MDAESGASSNIRENLRIGAVEISYLLRPRVLRLLLRIDRVSSYFRVTLPNKNYSVQDTAVSSFVQPRVMLSPSEEKVLELIAVNPAITGEKIAENLDVSLRHAKRILAELKEKGAIQRIGSDKSGHWEIIINMPGQKHQYLSR